MTYTAAPQRYRDMTYRTCGKSGLKLPLLSLGLWHNFGDAVPHDVQRAMVRYASKSGDAPEGLRLARALAMATYRSPEEFAAHMKSEIEKLSRALRNVTPE